MQAKELINTLADALKQVKAKHLAAHLLMLKPTQTLSHSLTDVKAHALAEAIANTLSEAKV